MNKSDSKYFNTAVKMDKALISILENKDFEFITVKEICEKAQVNRSTFYLHYENTYDLLVEASRYLIDNFLSYFDCDRKMIADKFRTCDISDLNFIKSEYLLPYLSYIRNNKRIFQTLISKSKTFNVEEIYSRLFQYVFDPILDRFHYPQDTRKYVMAFYLNGIMGIISEWLKNGCDKPIEKISVIISDCIFGLTNDFNKHIGMKK